MNRKVYGLLAEFTTGLDLLSAAQSAREAGYRRIDAFTPIPVEGLPAALGRRRNAVAMICLAGGILGGTGGYFLQDYAMATSYALNVGGRPLHSIPLFVPITFELTILCAAVCTVVGMLLLNGLPRLHHPIFAARGFDRATTDRFFLCIEARDPCFDPLETERFLIRLNPVKVTEVPA